MTLSRSFSWRLGAAAVIAAAIPSIWEAKATEVCEAAAQFTLFAPFRPHNPSFSEPMPFATRSGVGDHRGVKATNLLAEDQRRSVKCQVRPLELAAATASAADMSRLHASRPSLPPCRQGPIREALFRCDLAAKGLGMPHLWEHMVGSGRLRSATAADAVIRRIDANHEASVKRYQAQPFRYEDDIIGLDLALPPPGVAAVNLVFDANARR